MIFTSSVYYIMNDTIGIEANKALIIATASRNATTRAIEGGEVTMLNTCDMGALKNVTTHSRRILIANFSSIPATTIFVKCCLLK